MESARREKVPTKHPEAKKRKSTKSRTEFRGDITGFIDVARNDGDVTAYRETTYAGDEQEIIESPTSRRKTRRQNKRYSEDEDEFESSDDDRGGSIFYGKISGFVKEARGTGNATAMEKITYAAGASREKSLNNSRDRQRHSQPESEIMETRNITRSLNQEPMRIRTNITEKQPVQNLADPLDDLTALAKELQNSSPEMRRFVTSLARQSSRSMDDER